MLTDTDAEVNAVEGGVISLRCPVSGNPPPTVTWLRLGQQLSPLVFLVNQFSIKFKINLILVPEFILLIHIF